jgi:branched-chain amino acid transport system substrate-binding protein
MKRSLLLRGTVAAVSASSIPRWAAAEDAPLRIGLIFSYSGGSSTAAAGVDAAIRTFIAEHGATVGGRSVQIVKRDDTGIAPDVARRLAQELIVQEHVDVLMGCVYTPNAIAVADVSTQAHIPYFVINSATSNILAKNPYSARFGFTNAQITPPLAQFALRNVGKTAFSCYQDYAPGVDAAKSFATTFAGGGGTMLGEIGMPVQTTDFTPFIQRVKEHQPKVLFAFINGGGSGPLFLKACREAGLGKLGIQIMSSDDLVDENELDVAGDAALGIIAALNYTATHESAVNRRFVRSYGVNNKHRLPEYTGVAAYDIMTAIYKVAAAANGRIDPEKAMDVVRTLAFESPRGPIRIDPQTRDIVQNVYIRRVERIDGKLSYREIQTLAMVRDPLEQY